MAQWYGKVFASHAGERRTGPRGRYFFFKFNGAGLLSNHLFIEINSGTFYLRAKVYLIFIGAS